MIERTPNYRIVYFVPDPEDGERVAVALWVDDGRQVQIDYDPGFAKLHCIAPAFHPQVVRFLLDDIAAALDDYSSAGLDFLKARYSPQVIFSDARRILVPITEKVRQQLRERFLAKQAEVARALAAAEDLVVAHLEEYVRPFLRGQHVEILRYAKPQAILGWRHAINPVALALRIQAKIILVDGIDPKVLSAKSAVSKTNRVAHIFWQYGRLRLDYPSTSSLELRRIAIVLDGLATYTPAMREAREYALHQFRKEADLTVDEKSGEGKDIFAEAIAS